MDSLFEIFLVDNGFKLVEGSCEPMHVNTNTARTYMNNEGKGCVVALLGHIRTVKDGEPIPPLRQICFKGIFVPLGYTNLKGEMSYYLPETKEECENLLKQLK
jgi:hypothetical protein